jgi:hypothetical protein
MRIYVQLVPSSAPDSSSSPLEWNPLSASDAEAHNGDGDGDDGRMMMMVGGDEEEEDDDEEWSRG